MKQPPLLKKGDKIILLATSGRIVPEISLQAADQLQNMGYVVEVFPTAISSHHYFSGNVQQRLGEFQRALDDPNCSAILCVRGGYGAIHLLEELKWDGFLKSPKWLVGFSDITLLHAAVQKCGFMSLHGSMAKAFATASNDAQEILSFLCGNVEGMKWSEKQIGTGEAKGQIIGGNLSLITSIIGSEFEPDWENKILFIEDVSEYLYKIDRMLWTLKLRGIFNKISGLVLGQITDLSDTKIPYGESLLEIIEKVTKGANIPVAYGFQAGHGTPNHPILLGANIALSVKPEFASITYQSI